MTRKPPAPGGLPSRRCTGTKPDGTPCANMATNGRKTCRWHSRRPADIAARLAASSKGGKTKAYGALPATGALADDPAISGLDLTTAAGLTLYVAAHLHALARLPYDIRTAHAAASLVNAQRSTIEASSFEARLAELEATGPKLYGSA